MVHRDERRRTMGTHSYSQHTRAYWTTCDIDEMVPGRQTHGEVTLRVS